MRRFILRIAALALGVVAFVSVGCGGDNPVHSGSPSDPAPQVPPVEEQFLLGSWVSFYDYGANCIKTYAEQAEELKNFGINYLLHPYAFAVKNTVDDPTGSLDAWLEIDEVCAKNGIYYAMTALQKGANDRDVHGAYFDAVMQRNIDYSNYMSDYLVCFNLWDEPYYNQLEQCGHLVAQYAARTDIKCNVNLNGSSGATVDGKEVDYETYLRRFVAEVGEENVFQLGYDFYPFLETDTVESTKFLNMEAVRKVGFEYGLTTHSFIQSTCIAKINPPRRMPDYGEISWDIWSFLTYGFKALSYFNYVNPGEAEGHADEGFFDSFVSREGEIVNPELYEQVRRLNFRVRAVGDILVGYDAEHVYHTESARARYGDAVEYLPENAVLSAPADEATMIGQFRSRKQGGDNLFMVFNNSWNTANTFTYTVRDGYNVERFDPDTGRFTQIPAEDGNFTVDFGVGEGVLLRLVK